MKHLIYLTLGILIGYTISTITSTEYHDYSIDLEDEYHVTIISNNPDNTGIPLAVYTQIPLESIDGIILNDNK